MVAFAGTGFYFALLNPRDRLHQAARSIGSIFDGVIMTTEYVLMELGNFLSAIDRDAFVRFHSQLRDDTRTRIVEAAAEIFDHAVQLYAERADKRWSLTDCSSFVVMRKFEILSALTFDRHFEQAGFHLMRADT